MNGAELDGKCVQYDGLLGGGGLAKELKRMVGWINFKAIGHIFFYHRVPMKGGFVRERV